MAESKVTSMRDAVARFFEHAKAAGTTKTGRIREWTEDRRTEEARSITISATGNKPKQGSPCFRIADAGEGRVSARALHAGDAPVGEAEEPLLVLQ